MNDALDDLLVVGPPARVITGEDSLRMVLLQPALLGALIQGAGR